MHFTICAGLMLLASTTRGLVYRDIEKLGVSPCPTQNSCAQIGDASFVNRNCECDNACGVYDDCCIDAPRSSVSNRNNLPRHTCLPYDDLVREGTYVIDRCPQTYAGPTQIREQCQNNNFSDPLLSTPVTNVRNRRSYLNRYCAMCHEAPDGDLKTWKLTCRLKYEANLDLVAYKSDLGKWGVDQDGDFDECQFRFDRPSGVTSFRDCWSNLTSTCLRSFRRRHYVNACNAYTSLAMDKQKNVYRNPHCAVCNGVQVGDISCFSTSLYLRKKKPFSFALLFDINTSDGDIVGVSQRCPSGQKFDPYFKKCRVLKCAIPGFKLVNGNCVQQ